MRTVSSLALHGGVPVRTSLFPAYNPIGEEELRAVSEVMRSGILSQYLGTWHEDFMGGPRVRRFEAAWADFVGVKHALAVNSATSGLFAAVADFLVAVDQERLQLGREFGMGLLSITEWIKKAYPETRGDSICDLMRNNPAYFEIRAPTTLNSRLLTEDIPTGLVPFVELGRAVGVRMPLMESLVHIGSALLKRDFFSEGRTLRSLGLEGLSASEILQKVMS